MRVYSKFHLFDRPGPSHCFISRNQRSGRRGPSEGELIFGVEKSSLSVEHLQEIR